MLEAHTSCATSSLHPPPPYPPYPRIPRQRVDPPFHCCFTPLFKAPAKRMFGIGNPGNWCWAIVGVVALRHVMLCLGEFKMCETFWPQDLQYACLPKGQVRGHAGKRMAEFYEQSDLDLQRQQDYSEGVRELIEQQASTSGIEARLTCQLQQV